MATSSVALPYPAKPYRLQQRCQSIAPHSGVCRIVVVTLDCLERVANAAIAGHRQAYLRARFFVNPSSTSRFIVGFRRKLGVNPDCTSSATADQQKLIRILGSYVAITFGIRLELAMPQNNVRQLNKERDALQAVYGLYMRHRQLAEVMDISAKSLSNTMRRSQEPNIVYLRRNTVRLGRRIRYPVLCVAEALVLDDEELARRLKECEKGGSADDK